MIPAGFIQELLSRVDVVDVVGRHVELRKAGINHKGLCPFHGEKTPSFIVSPSRQTYHCFGCGAHGDAVRFLTDHVGLGFVEAVNELAQQVGLTVPDDNRTAAEKAEHDQKRQRARSLADVMGQASHFYRQQLKASRRAIDYLKGRGLTGEVAARFGIGYAPDSWRGLANAFPSYDDPLLEESGLVIVGSGEGDSARRYDRFRDRIMFPIRSVQGEVIGFGGRVLDGGEPKYLNSPETPLFVKGRELYGLHEARTAIRQAGHALVVEGYMDVVALGQLGFGQAVATLGTACTEDHVRKLLRFTDSIVFSFDGDAAGRKAAARALEACLPHAEDTRSIRFLFLPPEHDPDSFVREHGAAAFRDCIDRALPLSEQLLQIAKDGCALDTAEGRARFAAQAQPLWRALPDGVLRRQLLADIARSAGLPTEDLAQLWAMTKSASGASVRPNAADTRPAGTRPRTGGSDTWSPRRPTEARRRLPRSPADTAVALLLSNAEWWSLLTAEDIDILHALPAPHGTLVRWLEREVEDHGARPWAVVRTALEADPGLRDTVSTLRWLDDPAAPHGPHDLRRALDTLMLERLQQRQTELAERAAADPQAASEYRQTFDRFRALKQALQSASSLDGDGSVKV